MTGGENFVMGHKIASAGVDNCTNLSPTGAIQATQSTISIARTIHVAMAALSVSFASWERSVELELPGAHFQFTDHRIRIVKPGDHYPLLVDSIDRFSRPLSMTQFQYQFLYAPVQ
jgi:hypothetical protein